MVWEFLIGYAADKDHMNIPAGFVHVHVLAAHATEARLLADQMVAAVGYEPIGSTLLSYASGNVRR